MSAPVPELFAHADPWTEDRHQAIKLSHRGG
jgi:hypothetical protein